MDNRNEACDKAVYADADNVEGRYVTKNIVQGPDGIYRWIYEMSMYRNPTVFITVCKVMGLSLFIVYVFVLIVSLPSGGIGEFIPITGVFALLIFFMFGLTGAGYLIVAAMYGGKYTVLFEMDETSVKHIQINSQFKKARAAGLITSLSGLLAGNYAAAGAGLLAASKNSRTSEFIKVKSIKAYRSTDLIKVDQPLNHNQIYAAEEDFDFVFGYISERCINADRKT